jgi:hypothetical protein
MTPLTAERALPPPAAIHEAARDVLARPYFDLNSAGPRDQTPLLLEIIRWILTPFRWLFDMLDGLPVVVIWLIVIACIVLAALLIGHIIFSLVRAIQGPLLQRKSPLNAATKEYDPKEFEKQADLAVAREDYIAAIRWLFRATLRRLELFEKKKFRPGTTNRELLWRYRASPLAESLLSFVDTIDVKWYGQMPCGQAEYISCRNEHGRICRYIGESQPADTA